MGRKKVGTEIRDFLDSVLSGIVIIDIATRNVVFANAHTLALFGAKLADVVGRKCYEVLCPNLPDDCPVLDRGQNIDQGRCVIQTGDGRRIPVQKTVSRVEFEGRPCLLESFADISETIKLEEIKDDLERITRHDLKTPLIQIINLADLLLLDNALSPDHRTYAGMIQKTGRRMVRIINASLDLYKLERGAYSLFPQNIKLLAVLRDVIADILPAAGDRGVSFDLSFTEGVDVRGEDALIYCALSNLIKNAEEATPPGGKVRIAVRKGQAATVSIHNQRPIPPEIRDRFLDKYVTFGKAHGNGLGTYSARLSLQAMHGDLAYRTSDAEGTTVTVTLPLAEEETGLDYEEPALAG